MFRSVRLSLLQTVLTPLSVVRISTAMRESVTISVQTTKRLESGHVTQQDTHVKAATVAKSALRPVRRVIDCYECVNFFSGL